MLKGQEDILSPLAAQRNSAIKGTPCPRCGTALSPQLAPINAVFSPDDPLPKTLGWCQTCDFVASAETSVIYHTGDGRKVDDPLPIIRPKDD